MSVHNHLHVDIKCQPPTLYCGLYNNYIKISVCAGVHKAPAKRCVFEGNSRVYER